MIPVRESEMEQMQRDFASDAVKEVRKSVDGLENELDAWAKKLDGTNETRFKREVSSDLKQKHAALKDSAERLRLLREKVNLASGEADCLKECVEQTKILQSEVGKNLAKDEESNSSLKKKFTKLFDYARNKFRKTERSQPDAEAIAQHENVSEATFAEVENELTVLGTQLGSLQRLCEALQMANEREVQRQKALAADLANRRAHVNSEELRGEIAHLEQKRGELEGRIKKNEARKAEVSKINVEVNADIDKRSTEISLQERIIEELTKENSQLEAECCDLQSKKEALQKEMGDFMSSANSKILALEQEQQDVVIAKRNQMMEKREAMQQKVFETQKECYKLEETLNKLKAQLLRQGVDPETTTLESIREKIAAAV